MTLEIPEVRPAVLSPESAELLRRLLGFRHFFRQAYAVALDPARLDQFLSQVADAAGDCGGGGGRGVKGEDVCTAPQLRSASRRCRTGRCVNRPVDREARPGRAEDM